MLERVSNTGRDPVAPRVSIGIPTYNRAAGYLRDTLESVLAQTYPNIEIVVGDNGSTDGTRELVRSYQDPRIRYFRHEPALKANDNFNFCLNQASGHYFQLLHDDDLIDHDFVETCMGSVQYRIDVGLVRTGARIIDAQGLTLRELRNTMGGLSTADFFVAWLESRTWMFLACTLFNTARLREVGGFNSKHQLFQDVLAEFELGATWGRVDVPEVKASFRKHGLQNTTAAKLDLWCEDSVFLLEAMCRLAPTRQAEIRMKGLRHFAKHNYGLAETIGSASQRIRMYYRIYKTFEQAYSPLRFFFERRRARAIAALGRLKRRVTQWPVASA
jgi:glycosyltransferase involved in cell wall biosynthesis